MTQTHTAGPWEVGGGENGGSEDYVYCDNSLGSAVAIVRHDKALPMQVFSKAETDANAHLIAAAPEMLEALKEARKWFPSSAKTAARIDAAIAKAENRNDAARSALKGETK